MPFSTRSPSTRHKPTCRELSDFPSPSPNIIRAPTSFAYVLDVPVISPDFMTLRSWYLICCESALKMRKNTWIGGRKEMEEKKRPLKSVHFAERKSQSSIHLVESISNSFKEEPLPELPQSAGPFESETRFRTFSTGSGGLRRNRSIRRRDVNVDILLNADTAGRINGVGRFRLEPGAEQDDEEYGASSYPPVILENPQTEIRWYLRYFLGHEHQNFAGVDPHTKSPFFFSLLMEQEPDGTTRARAILWQKSGPRKLLFPISSPHAFPGKNGLAKSILTKFPGMNDFSRSLKEITEPKIQKDLIILEDQEGSINFKFGVIFRQYGQLSDDQMLSNEEGDDDFQRFLGLLGQRIELNGFGNFRGGLDTSSNSTGMESVYAGWAGHEIMFHVSTLLPFSPNNPQQVERKRHIGNDIVNIIFESDGDPLHPSFRPSMMKSHFTHIFALVTYEECRGVWRLWVFSEETVPAYGPVLPSHTEFMDSDKFRAFLMTKLINGEKAAFNAQAFTEKRQRTADSLIKDMYMEYMKDSSSNRGFQRVTDNMTKHWRGSLKNKDSGTGDSHAQEEFVKIGGLVKLEKMLSGDVPDYSEANTALCRKQPWEPRLVSKELPANTVSSSDSWGKRSVVLATSTSGVMFFTEGRFTCIIEPSAKVEQLKVLENFGLLIIRCDKGKEGYVSAFSLADIRSSLSSHAILTKQDCFNARIPETKGAHLFGVSDSNTLRLSLAVCLGKRVLLLRWALGPLGTLPSRQDLGNNFTRLNEVTFSEEPALISVFEIGPQSTVRACVASKAAIELVNFSTSIVTTVYRHDSSKGEIKSLLANCDESDGLEIVLTYGSTTLVFDPNHGDETLEIFWTSDPSIVAFVFPFLLAFSQDTLEVRLGINGSLLATLYMPRVQLLACKNDIIFSTRPHQAMDQKKEQSMACLYRIRSLDISGEEGGSGGRKISSSKTPQLTRNSSSNNRNMEKEGTSSKGNSGGMKKIPWAKNLEQSYLRTGSTGSDSGFGTQDRSSVSSMENCSVPASPLCHGDPFGEQ